MLEFTLPLASRSELKVEYQGLRSQLDGALEILHRRMHEELAQSGLRTTLKSRVKSFASLYEKLLRRLDTLDSDATSITIRDVLGLRVVCPFLDDVPNVQSRIERVFDVLERERKGSQPGAERFGYESVHCQIAVPREIVGQYGLVAEASCEVQIRTILQDAWAEVEHELLYKAEYTPFDEPVRRKLAAVNASLGLADIVFQEVREYQRRVQAQLSRRRIDFWERINAAAGLTEPDRGPPHGTGTDHDKSTTHGKGDGTGGAVGETPDLIDPDQLRGSGDRLDQLLLSALAAHNQQDFARAVELYSRLLSLEPDTHVAAVVHTHRGMAYFALADYGQAVEDFSATLTLDDENWKACFYRGLVHRLSGREDAALADFDRCVHIRPYQFDAFLARAHLHFDAGRIEAASRDCRRALELQPDAEPVRELDELIASARGESENGTSRR